jgi:hypothetical protein
MIDAVDSLLNNAVNFYVQPVDYCRISTSQIPTPIGAGIGQIKPESGDVQQMLPDSGDTDWLEFGRSGRISDYIAGSRPRSGHLVGILDESGRFGWISGRLAGSCQNAGSPAIWPGSWTDLALIRPERQDPQHLAENYFI